MREELAIPKRGAGEEPEAVVETTETEATEEKKEITQEEADFRDKVFFEDDDKVRLRDGRTYYVPPLGLKDARRLIKKLNTIEHAVIIANLIPEDEDGEDRYEEMVDVLLMAFKPYYPDMTREYLEDYVDVTTAAEIISILIGANGLKKSL